MWVGAAPNQEKLELRLKSGKNALLIKIHNGGGPSGFYFKSELKKRGFQVFPYAGFARCKLCIRTSSLSKDRWRMRVQWGSGKDESQSIKTHYNENCQVPDRFAAKNAFSQLQVFLQNGTKVRSIKILKTVCRVSWPLKCTRHL